MSASPTATFLAQHNLDDADDSSSTQAPAAFSARGTARYNGGNTQRTMPQARRAPLTAPEEDDELFAGGMDDDLPLQLESRGKRMSVRSYSPVQQYSPFAMTGAAPPTSMTARSQLSLMQHLQSHHAASSPLSPLGSAPKATAAISSLEEEKANMFKARLAACQLSEEFIDQCRPSVSREQLAEVWAHFGRSAGPSSSTATYNLTQPEARELAAWLYARIPVLFRSMVARANPSLSRAQCSGLVQEHLAHLLPGTSEEIVNYFMTTLKLQHDGRVNKDEFVRAWNRHARTICPNVQQKNTPKGTVLCTIL